VPERVFEREGEKSRVGEGGCLNEFGENGLQN
jgi:hypothetical protein